MIRTQIQLPDELYRAAKELAERREWSLAEIVRKGVEYVLRTCPNPDTTKAQWELPGPFTVGIKEDIFDDPDWRSKLNMTSGARQLVREKPAKYGGRKP